MTKRGLGSAAAAFVLAIAIGGFKVGDATALTTGDLGSGDDCVVQSADGPVEPIGADGAPVIGPITTSRSATLGRRHSCSLRGTTLTEISPPEGWSPLSASSAELETYRFPPRPTEPAELNKWRLTFAHYRSSPTLAMCETRRRNIFENSSNWAGALNTGSGFTTESVAWTQPGFQESCPSASAYSIWSGIGGWNNSALMQAGTDTSKSSLNGAYAFWELISPQHSNPEVRFIGSSVHSGDSIFAGTVYQPNNHPASAYFFVFDATTGDYYNTTVASYGGVPVTAFWNGAYAEAISESPLGGGPLPGGFYNLRKPTSPITFKSALSNGAVPSRFAWEGLNEGRKGRTIQTTNFSGGQSFTNTWNSCGT